MDMHDEIIKILDSGGTVYLEDDFEEIVVRIFNKDGKQYAFYRRHGSPQIQVEYSNKMIFEAFLGGDMITRKDYYDY